MDHNCSTLVLCCMDWRLSPPQANLDEVLLKNNIVEPSGFDRVIIGGGVKSLASAEKETDIAFVIRQLDIGDTLHHVKKMVLINHSDCGAYGGSANFKSVDAEHQFHFEELNKAAKLIRTKYPNIEVQSYVAHLELKDQKWSVYLINKLG